VNYPAIDLDLDTLSGMKPLRRVVFSLGGNEGDVLETLQKAVDAIASTPDVIVTDVSSVYRTTPVGRTDQADFLNIVVLAETMMSSGILLERMQAIEDYLGREREERWAPARSTSTSSSWATATARTSTSPCRTRGPTSAPSSSSRGWRPTPRPSSPAPAPWPTC